MNGRIREWVKKEKWKATLMPHTPKTNHKGHRYTEYNFNSGVTKKIYDAIITDMKNSHITERQLPTIISRCGLTMESIRRKLAGIEETHLYELEPMIKTLNYKMHFNYAENEIFRIVKVTPNYTYKQELNRIIIRRNIYPKFFINFNPDKPTDFEVNFHEETIKFKIQELKMVHLVYEGIETFYKEEKKVIKTKMKDTIRKEIRRQYLNDEIHIKNKK